VFRNGVGAGLLQLLHRAMRSSRQGGPELRVPGGFVANPDGTAFCGGLLPNRRSLGNDTWSSPGKCKSGKQGGNAAED
jgi:hypothetical protein